MPLAKLQLSAPPAIRYRQYESRLAPFCAGSLEPGARSAIGADEAGTLQAFKTIKTELLDPTIEAHNGELLSQRATGCSSSSGM